MLVSTRRPATKGKTLTVNEPQFSPGLFVKLVFQQDGNLVLFARRGANWVTRWSSETASASPNHCMMLRTGNLTLSKDSARVWSTHTEGHPGAHLEVQDDENLVIYQKTQPLWASQTSLDGLSVKGDGPKVFYLFQGIRRWIPDPETLIQQFGGWGAVTILSDSQVNQWSEGEPIPSVNLSPAVGPPVSEPPLHRPDDIIVIMPPPPPKTPDFDSSAVHACITNTPPPPPDTLPPPSREEMPAINSDGSFRGSHGSISSRQDELVGIPDKFWPTGQSLRVSMNGGTAFVHSKVRQFAEIWPQFANIHFEFVDPGLQSEIRISFEAGKGSWSKVGTDSLNVPFNNPTMNFGWFTDTTPDIEFGRIVLHEFGHALGLVHEHQSPVAGIQWDREKVYKFYGDVAGWDHSMVDANVFDRYSVSETNYSQFDPASIMEYHIPPEITLDGKGAPGNVELSPTDKEFIRKWYPFPRNPTGTLHTEAGDEIDFTVEYGVFDKQLVEFAFSQTTGDNSPKEIDVPITGSYSPFTFSDANPVRVPLPKVILDASRPIMFNKRGFAAQRRTLGFTWDVIPHLPGGSRLTLVWTRDQ